MLSWNHQVLTEDTLGEVDVPYLHLSRPWQTFLKHLSLYNRPTSNGWKCLYARSYYMTPKPAANSFVGVSPKYPFKQTSTAQWRCLCFDEDVYAAVLSWYLETVSLRMGPSKGAQKRAWMGYLRFLAPDRCRFSILVFRFAWREAILTGRARGGVRRELIYRCAWNKRSWSA